jgi:molecular chaperone DnaK
MAHIVGIDLGTTYSRIACFNQAQGKVIVIPNRDGWLMTPSVVSIDTNGMVKVGMAAKSRLSSHAHTVIEVKRDMVGTQLRTQGYSIEDILAFIIRYLKNAAEEYLGERLEDAVITVPAYYTVAQREAISNAGKLAGFNVRELVHEPVAAAIVYALEKVNEEQQFFVVYDLGGSHFDVSVVAASRAGFEVMILAGDPHLGGVDFDDEITNWVLRHILETHGVDLSRDEVARPYIKMAAEAAKEELTTFSETAIVLPSIPSVNYPALSVNIVLGRSHFEAMIMPYLTRSLQILDQAIEGAADRVGLAREDIIGVFLVGGSSRIPIVRDQLERHLGKPVTIDDNPDKAAVIGAATLAARIIPSDKFPEAVIPQEFQLSTTANPIAEKLGNIVHSVTALSWSMRVSGLPSGDFYSIIPRGTLLPRSVTVQLHTRETFSQDIRFEIFQGEDEWTDQNVKIGELVLPDLHKFSPELLLDVTFMLDLSETLVV